MEESFSRGIVVRSTRRQNCEITSIIAEAEASSKKGSLTKTRAGSIALKRRNRKRIKVCLLPS